MENIRKKLLIISCFLMGIIPNFSIAANSDVKLYLPISHWEKDIKIDKTQVFTTESDITWYIKVINSYLWFAIAWISMAVLIYAWIQMITAWWDKAKVSKWWKLALSCLIAIIISMLSYVLVNIIVKLF